MLITTEEAAIVLDDKYAPIRKVREVLKELKQVEAASLDIEVLIQGLESKERALKVLYKRKKIHFIALQNGYLGLSGRPSLEKIKILKEDGVTTIVTLLKEEEKRVLALGDQIKSLDIHWVWFPLAASQLEDNTVFKQEINNVYEAIIARIEAGEKILIHCAAGVHRTGSFSNGLLRKMGFSKIEAKEKIYEIRPVTVLEAIPKHWNWSERMIE